MKAAMKAVEKGSSINKATLDHDVPRTTLKDRLSGMASSLAPDPI